jgi:hypothetical protein
MGLSPRQENISIAFCSLMLADRLWSFIAGGLSLAQQAAPNEN